MKPKTVRGNLKFLEGNHVRRLYYMAFNDKCNFDTTYQREYELLFKKIVMKKIYKHFKILPYNTTVKFDFFLNQNGRWIGVFYEPNAITFEVKKVLHNDFSELDILSEYATPEFMFCKA